MLKLLPEAHADVESAKDVLRNLRVLRPLRLLRINEGIKLMFDSLVQSVASLYYVVGACACVCACESLSLSLSVCVCVCCRCVSSFLLSFTDALPISMH